MGLETGSYISALVSTNPLAADPKSQGDDHIRFLKAKILETWPNVSGAVTPTHTELNYVDGVTSAIQTQIDSKGAHAGQTWTGTHTFPSTTSIGNVSSTEIAYLDGVTSAIQTQIDAKGAIAGQTWTGTHDYTGATLQAATQTVGDSSTKVATTAFVGAVAFSAALPSQTGNSGKFVTTNGTTASWADAKISNVVTATTATTLTSTGTLLKITPASYGVTVTLPDATTCSVGGPLHIIDNRGAYPVRVCDSTGTLKGFIFAGVVSHISLDDASTAAGVWAIENNELVGASAQLLLSSTLVGISACIDLGSGKELVVGYGAGFANVYGVVYDKTTNTFGSVTVIRAATVSGATGIAAVLSAANQVLVVSCTATTAFEAVVLSISGTTITVNTAATATLSANISAFADGCGLIAVGSSFVTCYALATPANEIRALSISGTAVTIGAATALNPTAGPLQVASGSIVIALSRNGVNFSATPYTVSGSTLSAGTAYTDTNSTFSRVATFSTGRWAVIRTSSATVLTLSGTTVTGSHVAIGGVTAITDAIVVGTNKVLVLSGDASSNANILTDTAGTASAGTAITLSSLTSRVCLYVDGTDAFVYDGNSAIWVHKVSCSGASPVLSKTDKPTSSSLQSLDFSASNSVLSRSPNGIFGSSFAQRVQTNVNSASLFVCRVKGGITTMRPPSDLPAWGTTNYRGKSSGEVWGADAATVITKFEAVQ